MTMTESGSTIDLTIPEWTLGDRLRKAREHAKVKQEAIATRLNVGVSSVSNWESDGQPGRKVTMLELIECYAEITGVDAAWIAGFRTGSSTTFSDDRVAMSNSSEARLLREMIGMGEEYRGTGRRWYDGPKDAEALIAGRHLRVAA